ncbi:MAG: hypothetical protein ACFE95_08980 [Candidatus Hodarchaeota archaeon]
MKNTNNIDKESTDYCFFITYEPDNVKIVSKEQFDLIKEHYLIISALKDNMMSVKDIHNLYQDRKTGDYAYTLKTIYRHLDKLQKAGLVTAAGYREKIGSRSIEKVYSRTAKIFHPKLDEKELERWESENRDNYSQVLQTVLSELLNTSKPDKDAFNSLFKQFFILQYQTKQKLIAKAEKNSKFAESLSQIDITQLNAITDTISVINVFLQQPDLLNQMKRLLNVKESKNKND